MENLNMQRKTISADGNLMSCTSVYVKGSGGAAEGSVEVKCLVW